MCAVTERGDTGASKPAVRDDVVVARPRMLAVPAPSRRRLTPQ